MHESTQGRTAVSKKPALPGRLRGPLLNVSTCGYTPEGHTLVVIALRGLVDVPIAVHVSSLQ